jgi:hypothetical protein
MPSEEYVQRVERLARALAGLSVEKATIEVTVSGAERRESILRNQNDGELDALARKLKSRLGL